MRVMIERFHEACPEHSEVPCAAPDALVRFLQDACDRIDFLSALPAVPLNASEPITPDLAPEIRVLLISPEDLSVFDVDPDEEDGLLGLMIMNTPDSDPFGDESAYAKVLRALVVFDPERMSRFLSEEMGLDGDDRHVWEYEISEAATLFHEIAHGVMYYQNSGGLSPHLADTLHDAGMLGSDLGDLTSGYGIREIVLNGEVRDARDPEEAHDLLEAWCEEIGRAWAHKAVQVTGEFYAAAGIPIPEPDHDETMNEEVTA